MSTIDDSFIDVVARLEPKALAGSVMIEAHERAHEALIVAADSLDLAGNELNQKQRIELTAVLSQCLDGFEAWVEMYLRHEFERRSGDAC